MAPMRGLETPVAEGRLRILGTAAAIGLACCAIAGRLVALALSGGSTTSAATIEPMAANLARPDIVDRSGRLIATDVSKPSLFADPSVVIDRDEVVEKLGDLLPGLDRSELRQRLAKRDRRFVWIKRGLAPALAQKIHDLGLPGLFFRDELMRTHPVENYARSLAGSVDADNRGMSGIERFIDDSRSVDAVQAPDMTSRAPVRLSLDIGVGYALDDELGQAIVRYRARAAAGVVLDVESGEIAAAASLRAPDLTGTGDADLLQGGVYELGSVLKLFTAAMALDAGEVEPDTVLDVTHPLAIGKRTIADLHPSPRPLTVAEIVIRSSNIGAGLLAQKMGAERQRAFFERAGLLAPMRTEAGPLAKPLQPHHWGEVETATIAFGHGVAISPLQLAAAAAPLVNGGSLIEPTFVRRNRSVTKGKQVISPETSTQVRDLMRRVVTDPEGTGRQADVPAYRVGGKTGTAEIAVNGRYSHRRVIASFLAAFPIEAPRYIVLVVLFEPKPTSESGGFITAGHNAAPTTARIVARIAPLLGVMPQEMGSDPLHRRQ